MPQISAGLLMYRKQDQLEVFLGHPGGPFYKNKDKGSWSIPKGLVEEGEELVTVAIREFEEETGIPVSSRKMLELGRVKYKSGKILYAWAVEGQWEENQGLKSNTFELEWPPKSGRIQCFPEIDRAGWFILSLAKQKILPTQAPFLDKLQTLFIGN